MFDRFISFSQFFFGLNQPLGNLSATFHRGKVSVTNAGTAGLVTAELATAELLRALGVPGSTSEFWNSHMSEREPGCSTQQHPADSARPWAFLGPLFGRGSQNFSNSKFPKVPKFKISQSPKFQNFPKSKNFEISQSQKNSNSEIRGSSSNSLNSSLVCAPPAKV